MAKPGHTEEHPGWRGWLSQWGTSWMELTAKLGHSEEHPRWSGWVSQDTLWRLEALKSSVPWKGRGHQLCSASQELHSAPCFKLYSRGSSFPVFFFFIFVIFVFLIEEEGERLWLTLCFCTVILTIRGRCKGMLNPDDSSQQTCHKSHLIS